MSGKIFERNSLHNGKRRPRRIGVRIDLSSTILIAILLPLFYMITSVSFRPKLMEVILPFREPAKDFVTVNSSNLVTIRVDSLNRYWWNMGPAKDGLPVRLPQSRLGKKTKHYTLSRMRTHSTACSGTCMLLILE